eukprot:763625-Hanusia_phi.AAC.1
MEGFAELGLPRIRQQEERRKKGTVISPAQSIGDPPELVSRQESLQGFWGEEFVGVLGRGPAAQGHVSKLWRRSRQAEGCVEFRSNVQRRLEICDPRNMAAREGLRGVDVLYMQ